jgi:hypothetical protein
MLYVEDSTVLLLLYKPSFPTNIFLRFSYIVLVRYSSAVCLARGKVQLFSHSDLRS